MISNLVENIFATERYLAIISGAFLAVLGLLMLVRNVFAAGQEFRWWAVFIVLPALLFFVCAWATAHWHVAYRFSLTLFGLGLVVLAVASIFLLNLGWERWWPIMLIIPALTLFLLGLPDSALAQKPEDAAWVSLLAWTGAAAILLGLTFLAGNFHLIDLRALTNRFGWWGVFILFCAAGALFNGLWLWVNIGQLNLSVLSLGLVAINLLISAVFAWFRLDWRLELQWLFITSGILLVLGFFISSRAGVAP
jgi:hypothetical protein